MNQTEFNILVTNVTAIANQTFAIQCGEFASALATDAANELTTEPFDLNNYTENFDFQAILDSGYASLDELKAELNDAWHLVDQDSLQISIKQLPQSLANLTQKLTGDQLRQWITHTLQAQDESPFYNVHQIIMALFHGGDDDINDVIREAIAFDEIAGLIEAEDRILAEHILLDDLVTAATIQSFQALEWLLQRAKLNDEQVIELLESGFDEQSVFEKLYTLLSPTETQYNEIMSRAQNTDETSVITFLNKFKTE